MFALLFLKNLPLLIEKSFKHKITKIQIFKKYNILRQYLVSIFKYFVSPLALVYFNFTANCIYDFNLVTHIFIFWSHHIGCTLTENSVCLSYKICDYENLQYSSRYLTGQPLTGTSFWRCFWTSGFINESPRKNVQNGLFYIIPLIASN